MTTGTQSTVLVAAGCSPRPNILDVNEVGAMAYGAGCGVLVSNHYDSDGLPSWGLLTNSPAGPIRTVRMVQGDQGWIITGSADGYITCWDMQNHLPGPKLALNAAIATLDAQFDQDGNLVVDVADIKGHFYRLCLQNNVFRRLGSPLWFGLRKIISLAIGSLNHHLISLLGLSDNSLAIVINGNQVALTVSGHTNWVNSISILAIDESSLLAATGSSDRTIRIWKFAPKENSLTKLVELIPSKDTFSLGTREYVVECVAILYGHEGTINSVRWDVLSKTLISAGADHTIIRWKQDNQGSDSWQSILQIGDISSMGTVGSDRSFGFYSALIWRRDNQEYIIANGSTGSIVGFKLNLTKDGYSVSSNVLMVSGHTESIEGCAWEPQEGRYLTTVSLDKTCRIWFPSWMEQRLIEVARPQIHGYEMRSICVLNAEHTLSIADEKILRSFEAPPSFVRRLELLACSPKSQGDEKGQVTTFLPALGLSNKEVDAEGGQAIYFEAPLHRPPTEYDLCRLTLWRETDKLYGHGHELYSVAISPDGQLAASASKATNKEDAAIRLWICQPDYTWKPSPAPPIVIHSLTITRLVFSPDGRWLFGVSRDRQCSLLAINGTSSCQLCHVQPEAHSRIIWAADWSRGSDFLVTGSRDKTVKTWRLRPEEGKFVEDVEYRLEFSSPITALSIDRNNKLALGLEDGGIIIYHYRSHGWEEVLHLTGNNGGAPDAIKDIKWHPTASILAICSSIIQVFSLESNFK